MYFPCVKGIIAPPIDFLRRSIHMDAQRGVMQRELA
jgi:hypothetical protein